MKNNIGKTLGLAIILSVSLARAEDFRTSAEIETSCRIKAKEVAANTYRTCLVDKKNSQIEELKKEYQAKLKALKSHYEAELKKMMGSKRLKDKWTSDESDESSIQGEPGRDGEKSSEKKDEKSDINVEAKPEAQLEPKSEEKSQAILQESSEPVSQDKSETVSTDAKITEMKTEDVTPEVKKVEPKKKEFFEKVIKTPRSLFPKKSAKQKNTTINTVPIKKTPAAKNSKLIGADKQAAKSVSASEMSIELKPAPAGVIRDASGETPEPIPVELPQDPTI